MLCLFKSRPLAFLVLLLTMLSGCNCGGNVNLVTNSGSTANLTINGLASLASTQNQYVTVTFTGMASKNSGASGQTSFNTSREFEIDPNGNITPSTTLTANNLQPGEWSVTAQLNKWTASCTGSLSKGGSASFTFTFNSSGCLVK